MKTNFIIQHFGDAQSRILLLLICMMMSFSAFAGEEDRLAHKLLPPSVPSITVTPSASCYFVTLTATGCTAPYNYVQWYKDGYFYASGSPTQAYFVSPQPAFLKARCHDGAGTYGTFSAEIKYVSQNFTEVITPSPTVCVGGTVTLNASSASSTLTYQWRRNGTNISGATSASYTTGTTGDYSVAASGGGGSCYYVSNPLTITNGVPPAPVLSWNPAPSGYCQSQLTVSGCPPPAINSKVYRNAGASGWINVGNAPYFIPSSTTISDYRATCTLGGCESLPSNVVAGTPNNYTSITPEIPNICTTIGSVTMTANSTFSGLTFQWVKNGTNISGATSATYTTTTIGSYQVIATSPANGCSFTSASVVVKIVSPPTPSITSSTLSSPATIINGESHTLTANGCSDGGDAILWSTGETTSSITVSPSTSTNYTFTCTRSPCAVVTSPAFVINVTPLASPMLLSTSLSTCSGTSVTLTGSCPTGLFYWTDTPITSTPSITVSPSTTTTYNAACYYGVAASTASIIISVFDGNIKSMNSGNWNNVNTWSCMCIPASCNNVIVDVGHLVTIPGNITGKLQNLTVKGEVYIKEMSTMKLK
jgi:hypothetical protein